MSTICNCGLLQQKKTGTYMQDGVECCTKCRRPVKLDPASVPVARVPLAPDRITTLAELPGHRIVRVHGPVSVLTGSSGLTATSKGNAALSAALGSLAQEAALMRANAIVGLTGSAFGAAGGITSAFGGDAVGVMLLGTAVTVELLEQATT